MQRHCDYGICFAVYTSEVNAQEATLGQCFFLPVSHESWLQKTVLLLHQRDCTWHFQYAPSTFCTGKLHFILLIYSDEFTIAICCEVYCHKRGGCSSQAGQILLLASVTVPASYHKFLQPKQSLRMKTVTLRTMKGSSVIRIFLSQYFLYELP